MGVINDFIYGALLLAFVIALGITGWRAVNQGVFRAVSESYYGRKAQAMGGICLLVAIGAAYIFLKQLLGLVLLGVSSSGLFFLLGAGLGAYFTLRYYRRAI